GGNFLPLLQLVDEEGNQGIVVAPERTTSRRDGNGHGPATLAQLLTEPVLQIVGQSFFTGSAGHQDQQWRLSTSFRKQQIHAERDIQHVDLNPLSPGSLDVHAKNEEKR